MLKVSLSEASKAKNSGKRLSVDVVVTGKGPVPYIIPRRVGFGCSDVSPSNRCALCRFADSRSGEVEVTAKSRNILEILGKADSTVAKSLKKWMGVCDDCRLEVLSTQNVEELRVSPRVDTFMPDAEYVSQECYSLSHGLRSNRPYRLEGYVYPSPQEQRAVLVADKADPLRDQIEVFDFSKVRDSLELFRGRPEDVFKSVYDDFASNVHRIVGRYALQVAFDLCFHSVIQFTFQNVLLRKGWVEAFILGDSGQGKTEMSLCLLDFYHLGDRVQGEGSSTAGLIGGLERLGDRWILVWGRIPQMDRRLLIIDEFSGVSEEDIAKMSDIRSTGIAEITKIRTERASARTRLMMMSNTRDGQPLGAYNTGVEAIRSVFSHAEDVRRLEFAMCVATGEVSTDALNAERETIEHKYSSELCRNLILWAWSRTADDVVFADDVEEMILKEAVGLSEKYSASIPLVEPADMRLKLARLAVSCACRCFSCNEEGKVVVLPEHVRFVVDFLKRCYDSPYMSYDSYSERADRESVFGDGEFERALREFSNFSNWKECSDVLAAIGNPFRGFELGEQLGIESWDVREIVHFLSKYRMIQTLPAGYKKLAKMQVFLRGVAK